ncbi:PD-(D/E)XK nuclease family protein [Sedimentimonas flavescens]|uniref:PD-(D/E)XK nuclease family protein n=1 Tax=Sedimentimonas flavescens TaxID=2851012 RepID=UPI0021A77299|nr:PD-(D/E)XK nuclease family protein [Sedimentimonas flavescens]MCT2538764.1 PD-(D/E)XK nuclease family protein [Sedimentimonas flavescens]
MSHFDILSRHHFAIANGFVDFMRLTPLQTAAPVTGAVRPVTTGLLRDTYLVPVEVFDLAPIDEQRDAPWSQSLAVARDETVFAVTRALDAVARATQTLLPSELQPERLPEGRARRHLSALRDLWSDLGGSLPEDLQVCRNVIGSDAADALEPLPLLASIDCPYANSSEDALARVLRHHHGTAPDAITRSWQALHPPLSGIAQGALGHVQSNLTGRAAPVVADASLQVFGLRDPMEEAEFAAALVQRWLDAGEIDTAAEAGLLLPDDPAYGLALTEAFDRVGLLLSGAPAVAAERDSVSELIAALLPVLQGPAPRTALATVALSPLMPWSAATGRAIAREVIARGYSRLWRSLDGPAAALAEALRPVTSVAALFARLGEIDRLLAVPGRLGARIALLRAQSGEEPGWQKLQALVAPRPLQGAAPARTIEGVSVFAEPDLPWRSVRRLVVLGMNGRGWPRPQPANPFFTETEIELIHAATGLQLSSRARVNARRLELFRRQLCAATEAAVLLAPARDMAGTELPPTTGFALIGRLLGCKDPTELAIDPRRLPAEQYPVGLTARLPDHAAGQPVLPENGVVKLDRDLLALKAEAGGDPPAQSPTQLETLIISPLAWLLGEVDANDRTWKPELLDVRVLGTLLHGVIERVFPPDAKVPEAAELSRMTEAALGEVIARKAGWLAEPIWAAERASLVREALRMVRAWARFLSDNGAVTLGNELSLSGDHAGLMIAGRADSLLQLPDGRYMVIDHKRSSAAKRRSRMELGWDLQVALYRVMLERSNAHTALAEATASGATIVTAYHTTLDGAVLADGAGRGLARVECPADDPAREALKHLQAVVSEVRNGCVTLNRAGDAKRFGKERGITAYALEGDELVGALLMPEEQTDEVQDD